MNAEACMIHDLPLPATFCYNSSVIPAGDCKESSLKAHHTQNSADSDCNQDKGTDNSPKDRCLQGGSITLCPGRENIL